MTTITKPTASAATNWQLDPAHTQVEFEVTHLGFAKVRGRFRTVEGTLHRTPRNDGAPSHVEAVIQSASIDTGQPERDAHLRSPEFLDVERYPELRFHSRDVRPGKDGTLNVEGDLTIRGVTRPVELKVRESGAQKDPWGNQRMAFTATTTIDRRAFGLTWNQALEAGGLLVSNDVRILLEVQAIQVSA